MSELTIAKFTDKIKESLAKQIEYAQALSSFSYDENDEATSKKMQTLF